MYIKGITEAPRQNLAVPPQTNHVESNEIAQ